jgi:glycosyltransferase involved in cell wall biosynthesis
MRRAVVIVPGSLETRTGGYEYDRRIVEGLRNEGWWVDVRELSGRFPQPTAADRQNAARVLAGLPARSVVVVDGLALGALPEEIEREASRLRLVALVHHPLALETGVAPALGEELRATERRALAVVRRVIVTGHSTAQALDDYGVKADRLSVIEPGTDPAPLARGSGSDSVHMICVASLVPRKGHDLLLRALAAVPSRNWRLRCVGGDRDAAVSRKLREMVRELGLSGHVEFEGESDGATVASRYDTSDLFVLATWYEGYGMAVAEALARGLPIVSTRTGAIPEIVPDNAGVLVEPGDVDALTAALTDILGNPSIRVRLAEGARLARARLPTWPMAAVKLSSVLESVAHG